MIFLHLVLLGLLAVPAFGSDFQARWQAACTRIQSDNSKMDQWEAQAKKVAAIDKYQFSEETPTVSEQTQLIEFLKSAPLNSGSRDEMVKLFFESGSYEWDWSCLLKRKATWLIPWKNVRNTVNLKWDPIKLSEVRRVFLDQATMALDGYPNVAEIVVILTVLDRMHQDKLLNSSPDRKKRIAELMDKEKKLRGKIRWDESLYDGISKDCRLESEQSGCSQAERKKLLKRAGDSINDELIQVRDLSKEIVAWVKGYWATVQK
ncbi:MAG: hypothetical protein JNL01_02920 [Bdellovibrionales bacterium]|nr:hypothetical protein [Bdellovibrionales bacterium]